MEGWSRHQREEHKHLHAQGQQEDKEDEEDENEAGKCAGHSLHIPMGEQLPQDIHQQRGVCQSIQEN